jgi:hypothetical protein
MVLMVTIVSRMPHACPGFIRLFQCLMKYSDLCAGGPLCGVVLSAQDPIAVPAEHNW